jgi:NADPH-dependent 2,4-dienoyl-CoA reductase/sulfur reductase-like enzyme
LLGVDRRRRPASRVLDGGRRRDVDRYARTGCVVAAPAMNPSVVVIGAGPLLYLVAAQYVNAGARVEAVIDTSPALRSIAALRGLLSRPELVWRGAALIQALRRAGVRRFAGATPIAIDGDANDGVRGIAVRDRAGATQRIECDAVALGYHLRAETQLADLAGCEFAFDRDSRQWLPRIDDDGRSSRPRVYLAGDGARILGADGAEAAGRLAAFAALRDLGHPRGVALHDAGAPALRATLRRMDAFRAGLARAFPWPHAQAAALPDDAVVCRCETITAAELRRAVHQLESREVNRAKAFSRVGMGRCQGRYCGHAAAEVIAHAAGISVEEVGRLRSQAPVKPLVMDALEADG